MVAMDDGVQFELLLDVTWSFVCLLGFSIFAIYFTLVTSYTHWLLFTCASRSYITLILNPPPSTLFY